MRAIIRYIREYIRGIPRWHLLACTLLTAGLVYLNYVHQLEYRLSHDIPVAYANLAGHYLLFLAAFGIPYLLYFFLSGKNYFQHGLFALLVIAAPAIFAYKMTMDSRLFPDDGTAWQQYWNQVVYWPARVGTLTIILLFVWKLLYPGEHFFGAQFKSLNPKPYLLMLAIMVPLIAAAATQPDFQAMYPKLKEIYPLPAGARGPSWIYALLFELSYGSDFFSIELFFRGFLVLGFVRWAGRDAILPMACFYCTIHFGKPLGECISSFFGGIILGVVTYRTGTIYGGLMVHLGIAWLMELGGYLGNLFQ